MPYDRSKDPFTGFLTDAPHTFGFTGRVVTPSDVTDIEPYAKTVVVTVGGDLVILPAGNADADTIAFTGCPVGFIPPFRVRRVLATGTTASVASVDA